MIQVANNVTDTTVGGANSAVSLTFDALGVISAASNVALQVNTADIVNGAITADKIADGTIIAADVADGSITTAKIADGNVTSAKIDTVANTQVTGVMTTSQVADSAITASKLATTVAGALGVRNLIINGD